MANAKKKGNAHDQNLDNNAQGNAKRRASPCPVSGLTNLGNTCYFNSAIQLLAACPPLVQSLLQPPGAASAAQQLPSISKGPLGFALQQAIMHMHGRFGGAAASHKQLSTYNPQALHSALVRVAPQFKGWQQHDSQEALHALLDALQEEAAKLHALMHGPPARRASQEQPPPSSPAAAAAAAKASTTAAAVNPPTASASSSSPAGVEPSCTLADSRHAPSSTPPSEIGNVVAETLNDVQNGPQADVHDAAVSCSQDEQGFVKSATDLNDGGNSTSSSNLTSSTTITTTAAPPGKAVEQQAADSSSTTSAGTPPEVVSLINSLFRGQLKSTVTCQACRHSSSSNESFLELSVPIPTPAELKQLRAGIQLSAMNALPDTGTEATGVETETKISNKGVKAGKAGKADKLKGKKGKAGQAVAAANGSNEGTSDAVKHEPTASGKGVAVATTAGRPAKETAKERKKREAEEKRAAIEAKRNAKKMQDTQQDVISHGAILGPEQPPTTEQQHMPIAAACKSQANNGVTSVSAIAATPLQHDDELDRNEEQYPPVSLQVPNQITPGFSTDAADRNQYRDASSVVQDTHDDSKTGSCHSQFHMPDDSTTSGTILRNDSITNSSDCQSERLMQSTTHVGFQHHTNSFNSSHSNGSGHVCITGFDINPNSCNNGSGSAPENTEQLDNHSNGSNGSFGDDSSAAHVSRPAIATSHSALSDLFKSHPLSSHGSMSEISGSNSSHTLQLNCLENSCTQEVQDKHPNGTMPPEHQPDKEAEYKTPAPEMENALAAAYRLHNVSHTGLHLLDCLGLFFSAEHITWECPKEKSEARDTFARLSHAIRSASLSPAAEGVCAGNRTDVSEAVQLLQRLTSKELLSPVVSRSQQPADASILSATQAVSTATAPSDSHQQNTSETDNNGPVTDSPTAGVIIGSDVPVQASPFQHEDVQQPTEPPAAITCPTEAPAKADWFGHNSPLSPLINMLSHSPQLSANQPTPLSSLASLTHMSTVKTPLSNTISQLFKKQVRFSSLPPAVRHIPGGIRQKGHELQAALRGDVPFMRPACTPTPASLQEMAGTAAITKQGHKASAKDGDDKTTKKERSKVVEVVAAGNDDDASEQDETASKKGEKKGNKRDKKNGKKQSQDEPLEGPSRFLKEPDTAAEDKKKKKDKKDKSSGGSKSKKGKTRDHGNDTVDSMDGDGQQEDSAEPTLLSSKASKKSGKGSVGKTRNGHTKADVTPLKKAINKANDKAETDQWLEGETTCGLTNKQPMIKGLMIQAQLIKPALSQICVRVAAGPDVSPGLAAVLFEPCTNPQDGLQLCIADIQAAWQQPLTNSSTTTKKKKQAAPAAQQPDNNDTDIVAEVAASSEEVSDWETDSGSSSNSVVDDGTSQADGGISTLTACTVCDAVQVMMDCAAHIVLTNGMQGAMQALAASQPAVTCDRGKWCVHGIDPHTKQAWTFPPHAQQPSNRCTTTTPGSTTVEFPAPPCDATCLELAFNGVHGADDGCGQRAIDNSSLSQSSSKDMASQQQSETIDKADNEGSSCNTMPEYVAAGEDGGSHGKDGQCRLLGGRQEESCESSDTGEESSAVNYKSTTCTADQATTDMHSSVPHSAPIPCNGSHHDKEHQGDNQAPSRTDLQKQPSVGRSPVIGSTTPPGTSRLKKPSSSVFQRQAFKKYTLEVLPKVLLIHLKRFHHAKGSAFGKLNMHISFPDILDVSHLMCDQNSPQTTTTQQPDKNNGNSSDGQGANSQTGNADKSQKPQEGMHDVKQGCNSKYKLAGLIEHQGGSMRCGHYVAYVCHRINTDRPMSSKQESHAAAPMSHSIDTSDTASNASMERIETAETDSSTESSDNHDKQAAACMHTGDDVDTQWYCISDATVTPVSYAKVIAAQGYVLMYLQC